MLPEKIKTIREMLGVTVLQVSKTININSYKYKKGESEIDYLSTDMIILLSVIYKIKFTHLLLNRYSKEDILQNEYLNSLKGLESEQIVKIFEDNLCSYFPKKRKKANASAIDAILKSERKAFGARLRGIRESQMIEISLLAEMLGMQVSTYRYFEAGYVFPTLEQIKEISECLYVDVSELISL